MSAAPPPPPGPAAPPPRPGAGRPPPGRGWYAVAVVLLAASLVGAPLAIFTAVRGADLWPEHFAAPDTLAMAAERGVTYTIFLHSRGSALGDVPAGDVPVPTLACAVTHRASGEEVPLRRTDAVTLTLGANEYVSRWAFSAARDGAHEVQCRHADDPGTPLPLAVGQAGTIPRLVLRVGVAAVLGLAGLLAGTAVAVFVAVRRAGQRPVEAAPAPSPSGR